MKFAQSYLENFSQVMTLLDKKEISKTIELIHKIKVSKGRIFFLGVGGSAGNASHAVNDFRKITEIECYAPTDNVSELTARINDEGWDTSITEWLKISNLNKKDLLFIFSVGGGNLKKNVSINLVNAIKYGKKVKSKITGIIGRDGGFTKKNSNTCILVPTVDKKLITPSAESMQAVIWHLIVSHPKLLKNTTKWESIQNN
jgi:D-sedoheptulose 7-phosphate isomerase|tara:strand:- start:322 stop:924 length:603 start_codon:yes stop_codon:yes gene_type:complete